MTVIVKNEHIHISFQQENMAVKSSIILPLSPVKYFNQIFLNYTQKFALDSDYTFFVHSVLLKLYFKNQIKIAAHKVFQIN